MKKKERQAQGKNTKEQPRKREERQSTTILTNEECIKDIILTTALISSKKLSVIQALNRLSAFPPDLQIIILATCEAVALHKG